MAYKQAILIRQDLQLPKGKAVSQGAHAAVEAVLRSDKDVVKAWRQEGMKKIVLKVKDLKELEYYNQEAKDMKMITALITDAGKTTVEPGTVTCFAIGPENEEKLDKLISTLKLY
ncbi:peptidyl-tRNA hydrolase [Candidatus Woesearchaeota archaeon]|nr:peptidyl-tRNA hydrolase [Candidatus Woesearchaeota archaeon]